MASQLHLMKARREPTQPGTADRVHMIRFEGADHLKRQPARTTHSSKLQCPAPRRLCRHTASGGGPVRPTPKLRRVLKPRVRTRVRRRAALVPMSCAAP